MPSLGTGPVGRSSGVPPGSGEAAGARMWGASFPCREASHGKECWFPGFAAGWWQKGRGDSPFTTHLSVGGVGPQGWQDDWFS